MIEIKSINYLVQYVDNSELYQGLELYSTLYSCGVLNGVQSI